MMVNIAESVISVISRPNLLRLAANSWPF